MLCKVKWDLHSTVFRPTNYGMFYTRYCKPIEFRGLIFIMKVRKGSSEVKLKLSKKACIIYHDKKLYGKELREKIDIIKQFFGAHILDGDRPIALYMERSPNLIILEFALLEMGIVFLPLHPSYPEERIRYMLDKAKVQMVITENNAFLYEINRVIKNIPHGVMDIGLILASQSRYSLPRERKISASAYIIFTSGTSGKPKAVEILKSSLENLVESGMENIDFLSGKTILSMTSHTFDIFFFETILPLILGLTVVLTTETERKNPAAVLNLIEKYQVTMIQGTPSMMKLICAYDKELKGLKNVSEFMIGGEQFPVDLLQQLQRNTSGRIYNMYGPTETTVWSTIAELTGEESVHIGKPIRNTRLYLLDEELKECGENEIGEIAIAGRGLAKGYLDEQELTEKRFVFLPSKERVYLTGDLGRKDSQGNFYCLGRKDQQVKLRGHRIELEEIEMVMRERCPVLDVCACFSKDKEAIYAFYMAERNIEQQDFCRELKKVLPEEMVPRKFIRVSEFIYNINGKTDKNAMMEKQDAMEEVFFQEDQVQGEIDVIGVIEEVMLEPYEIDPETEMEKLNLSSLEYVQIMVTLEDIYQITFDMDCLSREHFHKVKDLEEYVSERRH